jgi:hypothetical protein
MLLPETEAEEKLLRRTETHMQQASRVPSEAKILLTYFSLTLPSSKVCVVFSSPECRAKS